MLKNKKVIFLLEISLMLILLSTNSGICVDDIAMHTPDLAQHTSVKPVIYKFLKVMGGVALSSIIIFAGLWIYNKLFFRHSGFASVDDQNTLATPKNVDSAIAFVIKRNKI